MRRPWPRSCNGSQPTHLLHLAWDARPGLFWTSTENLRWVAASLGLYLAFAASGGRRAVVAGSCAEYDWSHSELDEARTPLVPRTLYGEAKRALHTLLERAAAQSGVELAWGRLFFLYGPHEAEGRLVSDVARALLAGREARCSEGSQQRDFMHVADAGRAFAALVASDVTGPGQRRLGRMRAGAVDRRGARRADRWHWAHPLRNRQPPGRAAAPLGLGRAAPAADRLRIHVRSPLRPCPDRGLVAGAGLVEHSPMATASNAPRLAGGILPSLAGLGPGALVRRLLQHRYLLRQLIRKNVSTVYQGSMLGVSWIVVRPLLQLVIFGFCFGVVYQGRFFAQRHANPLEFALVLFVGLAIFSLVAEMLSVAPGVIAGNANFVKKVVFPLDLLVPAQLGSSLIQLAMSATVFLLVRIFLDPPLGWAALSVPILIVPLMMLTLGVSWFLASLGVFVRDLQQIVPLGITGLMFLSPLFYPVSAVPPLLRSTIYLNPLTFIVESARNALFLGTWPDPLGLAAYFAAAGLAMWCGWVWFEKTRKGFADVL